VLEPASPSADSDGLDLAGGGFEWWYEMRLKQMLRLWLSVCGQPDVVAEGDEEAAEQSIDGEHSDEAAHEWDDVEQLDDAYALSQRNRKMWRRTRMAMGMVVGLPMAVGVPVFDHDDSAIVAPATPISTPLQSQDLQDVRDVRDVQDVPEDTLAQQVADLQRTVLELKMQVEQQQQRQVEQQVEQQRVPEGRVSPFAPVWSVRAAQARGDWLGEPSSSSSSFMSPGRGATAAAVLQGKQQLSEGVPPMT
jgi:hypothetical protein